MLVDNGMLGAPDLDSASESTPESDFSSVFPETRLSLDTCERWSPLALMFASDTLI